MKKYIINFSACLALAFILGIPAHAQVAINTSGVVPNASSMLDITSTSSGMLVPRMTLAQRTAIATPATSLLVFQTNGTAGFYYYTGAAWQYLNTQWTFSGTNIAFPVGSVGINIAAPTRTLDVNGTARIGANGTTITNIIKAAITQTVGAVGARASVTVTFAVANAATTSSVVISPLNALPANILIAFTRVSAVGSVQVVFYNASAASVNVPSNTYYITVIQ
jgi:hypothetical protein